MSRIFPLAPALALGALFIAAPSYAESYVAIVAAPDLGTTLTLTADLDAAELEIRSTGPADRFFAWGFGGTEMSDTYALITNAGGDESLTERKLGDHSSGTLLDPSLVVQSSTIDADILTVVATRPFAGPDADYFEFTPDLIVNGEPFDMIWSLGSSTMLAYHGSNRDTGSATFDKDVSSVPGDDPGYGVVGGSWGELKVRFEKLER